MSTTKDCEYFGELGNAAKMRAALLIVKRLFDGRIMFWPAIRKAHKAVDAALSEPPRNCDLFGGDPKKLHELWWEWSGDPKNCNADGTVKFTFGEWLLKSANAKVGAE